MSKVSICGIPHTVEVTADKFDSNTQGIILFNNAKIRINAELTPELKQRILIHETVHGILTYLGYLDLSVDEVFVSSLAGAIDESFSIKEVQEWESIEEKTLRERLNQPLKR